MNVEKLLLNWLIKAEKTTLSDITITTYKWNIKAFLINFEAKNSPEDITLEELKTYLGAFASVNTQYVKLNSIKSFFRTLEIKSLDFESFDKPKRTKKQPKKIDEKYLLSCINEIDNRKHKALISLAYASGMWLGEIIDLKLVDIDLNQNMIIVRNKDKAKGRVINISSEVSEIILRYIRKFAPVEYLFNGQDKPQYSKKSALNALQKAVGHQYNFHLLRNTHIYHLIESGNDLKKINEHLGTAKSSGKKVLNFYKKYSQHQSTRIKPPM